MGLAYLKKGDKKKAVQMLDKAMEDNFQGILSAENIDFNLIETFMHRNIEREKCKAYAQKALALAQKTNEEKPLQFISKFLDSFEVTEI